MTFEKPTTQEEEFFVREDAERLRKLHMDEQRRLAASELQALREKHQGRCSGCGAQLVPEKIESVVIQHCPACGGAFLDKRAWETFHQAPHAGVVDAVLNWFRSANKP